MAGSGGEMQGDVRLDYYPSNMTLTIRYKKTTTDANCFLLCRSDRASSHPAQAVSMSLQIKFYK